MKLNQIKIKLTFSMSCVMIIIFLFITDSTVYASGFDRSGTLKIKNATRTDLVIKVMTSMDGVNSLHSGYSYFSTATEKDKPMITDIHVPSGREVSITHRYIWPTEACFAPKKFRSKSSIYFNNHVDEHVSEDKIEKGWVTFSVLGNEFDTGINILYTIDFEPQPTIDGVITGKVTLDYTKDKFTEDIIFFTVYYDPDSQKLDR